MSLFSILLHAPNHLPRAIVAASSLVFLSSFGAFGDPLTSNNGFYPDASDYAGPFVAANLDYPDTLPDARFPAGGALQQPLTVETAQDYMLLLKEYITPSFSTIINEPTSWDPKAAGWYDLVWSGGSNAPTGGREALMNTYTGQIIHATSFGAPHQPTSQYVQNHAVIYYDARAASMLGSVWADLYDADLSALSFPEGSIVIKAEATTPAISQWPSVLDGAATWQVFRPSTLDQATKKANPVPKVVEAHPLQMSIKVKDRVASPVTGWVFMAFVYDAAADGPTVWDRFVPLGAMWGNDPQFNRDPKGLPANARLTETWVNPDKPAFTEDTLGWGGRMAGPMDVATRQGVITARGTHMGDKNLGASSCMSCHGAGEYPFTVNLYPSPNSSFPPNGEPFLLYEPGSVQWAQWFENRPGDTAQSGGRGPVATDYDMAIMFALGATPHVSGKPVRALERFSVH
ncbi:hypothetical protein [uncultured Shimia sp.]|uniref:hypothetical protein n=1 Tax=uncultured Shimia sp. TaxID=573152 RepID=UPI0025ECC04C|nr:hypothetical protein [uncultured Shimia sp.]